MLSLFKQQKKEKIDVLVDGIPAIAKVMTYNHIKGSFSRNAPSDLDFYGYYEIEFKLLDRKGYHAPWLERKVDNSPKIRNDIEEKIIEFFEDY